MAKTLFGPEQLILEEETLEINGVTMVRIICPKCNGVGRRGLGPCMDCTDGLTWKARLGKKR